MKFQPTYRRIVDRIDLEHVLLIVMLISSGYMLWESYNFGISAAATFPRLTAGFVLVGTLLLIFQSYLPEPLYSFVAESAELINVDDEDLVEEKEEKNTSSEETAEESEESVSTVGRPIHDSLFTAISALGYGILGYAIGIMWASPIFIIAYGLWFKLSWKILLVLVAVSLLIAFGFYEALGLRIDRGSIFFTEGVL